VKTRDIAANEPLTNLISTVATPLSLSLYLSLSLSLSLSVCVCVCLCLSLPPPPLLPLLGDCPF
jgi:hypothetical protein